jgi:hypothetical protein
MDEHGAWFPDVARRSLTGKASDNSPEAFGVLSAAFIKEKMVPRLHSMCGRVGTPPTEAGFEWKNLEIPHGVDAPLASLAAAFC